MRQYPGIQSEMRGNDETNDRNWHSDVGFSPVRAAAVKNPGKRGDVGERRIAIRVPGDGNPDYDRTRGDGQRLVCAVYYPHQIRRSSGSKEAAVHYCGMVRRRASGAWDKRIQPGAGL